MFGIGKKAPTQAESRATGDELWGNGSGKEPKVVVRQKISKEELDKYDKMIIKLEEIASTNKAIADKNETPISVQAGRKDKQFNNHLQ